MFGISLTTGGLEITHTFTLCSVADLQCGSRPKCPKVELGIIETSVLSGYGEAKTRFLYVSGQI